MEDAALPPVQPNQSETLPSLQGQAVVTPPSRPVEPAEQSRSDQERIQADIAQLSARLLKLQESLAQAQAAAHPAVTEKSPPRPEVRTAAQAEDSQHPPTMEGPVEKGEDEVQLVKERVRTRSREVSPEGPESWQTARYGRRRSSAVRPRPLGFGTADPLQLSDNRFAQIGRASCRERV